MTAEEQANESVKSQEQVKPAAVSSTVSPGQQLAEERKKQGLTEREVADQLKITLSKLSALEKDQYEKFPAEIYLKGYLKNYARLLRLPEYSISDSYKAFYRESGPEELPPAQPVEDKSQQTWLLVIAALIIALILIVIVSQLGQSSEDDFAGNNDAVEQSEESPLTDEVPVVVEALSADSDNSQNIEISADALESDGTLSVNDDTLLTDNVNEGNNSNQSSPEVIEDKPVEILASKVTAAELISLIEPEVEEAPSIIEEEILADVLDFQFANQCWIEVRDSTGSLLYAGLENAGTQRQIEGEGPFQIVIGNVSGTELSFNGEAIVLDTPSNGRALRLQVGG